MLSDLLILSVLESGYSQVEIIHYMLYVIPSFTGAVVILLKICKLITHFATQPGKLLKTNNLLQKL